MTSAETLVMVRFAGELATKSRKTRARFQRRLADNLRDAYESRGLAAEVTEEWGRFYVRSDDAGAVEATTRVFGVSSCSEIRAVCEAELDEIVGRGHELFADAVRGHTFAVRARRSGEHPFTSYDVQRELGAALNPGAEVDLDDPDVTVRVEVRSDRAYLFSEKIPGPGGLPLGVQSGAVALVSGGFDSAVAAWMSLRRGVELDYLFCNLDGGAYRRMVLEVAKELADEWSFGSRPRLHAVDFGPVLEALRERVRSSYWQLALKRLMYRAGERVARETGAEALVTGESIGQVSSQTLKNLRAIDAGTDLPVLRPLVGFDKEQILERSRRIGTFDLSSRVREYCAIVPDRPVTAATPGRVDREMDALEDDLVDRLVEERQVYDLRSMSRSEIAAGELFIDRVPEGAAVIDVRSPEGYREWHWPGSERRDLDRLAGELDGLDSDRTYVLVCGRGLRTAHLAEEMQSRGLEAYSFAGGARKLRRHARDRNGAG